MKINFCLLENTPIFKQLQIEEALLRADNENWCILNIGSPKSIVMGLSSKMDELLEKSLIERDQIPIIQRFSGGGTVIVDENTLFGTFIFQAKEHFISPFPKPILDWTASFYKEALAIPSFALEENDYVVGSRKIGGNAQYIRQSRWLHHTTFLFDFEPTSMNYLKNPPRQPKYRQNRSHADFLTTLKPFMQKSAFPEKILSHLKTHFTVEEKLPPSLFEDHRKSTQYIQIGGNS